MPRQFTSNADEIRFYIKELLADCACHSREEIRDYVMTHADRGHMRFTEGMFTGALRDLVVNSAGKYITPSRAVYQKSVSSTSNKAENIRDILMDAVKRIENECQCNITEISEADLQNAGLYAEILKILKDYITKL